MFCYTGVKREEELLKGLLTDDYCHVCEAVLLFESQRLSHYEVCAVTEPVIVRLILWLYDDYVSYKPLPPLSHCRERNTLRNSGCTCRQRELRRGTQRLQDHRFALM